MKTMKLMFVLALLLLAASVMMAQPCGDPDGCMYDAGDPSAGGGGGSCLACDRNYHCKVLYPRYTGQVPYYGRAQCAEWEWNFYHICQLSGAECIGDYYPYPMSYGKPRINPSLALRSAILESTLRAFGASESEIQALHVHDPQDRYEMLRAAINVRVAPGREIPDGAVWFVRGADGQHTVMPIRQQPAPVL